jgi:hypothetical protein
MGFDTNTAVMLNLVSPDLGVPYFHRSPLSLVFWLLLFYFSYSNWAVLTNLLPSPG